MKTPFYTILTGAVMLVISGCGSERVDTAELTTNSAVEDCGREGPGGLHVRYHIVDDVEEMDSDFLNEELYEAYNADFQEVTGYTLQDVNQLADEMWDDDCRSGYHFETEVDQNGGGVLGISWEVTYYADADNEEDKETWQGSVELDLHEKLDEWFLLLQERHM